MRLLVEVLVLWGVHLRAEENNMADPSIPFNSYFDQQGQDNILNKLMDFKANRWQDAVAKGFQGVQQAVAAAQAGATAKATAGVGGDHGSASE